MDADLRRFAAFLVPFGRGCDQFAVAVAAGDVGHHGRRQRCRFVDFLALLGDRALVGEFAQDAFQLNPVGISEAEFPRDLAGADFPRMRADECDNGVPLRKNLVALLGHSIRLPYPLALPTVFLATGFATLAGEVVADAVTSARALLAASDFGFAAAFFATAFLAGFAVFATASTLAGFAALAFLAPRFGLPPPLATRSSISAIASGRVMVSWVLSLGMVALTPPAVT